MGYSACFGTWWNASGRVTQYSATPARSFTIQTPQTSSLDLNLPGNLDHIFGSQIETVDDLDRIAIEKRKQREAPAPQSRSLRLGHNEIAGSHEQSLVEIDGGVESTGVEQCLPQIRNLEEPEARHQMPQALADIVDDGAGRTGNARRVLEYHAESDGVPGQNSGEVRMINDETRYFLCASRQEHRGAFDPGNQAVLEIGQKALHGQRRLRKRCAYGVRAGPPSDHDDEQNGREGQRQPPAVGYLQE